MDPPLAGWLVLVFVSWWMTAMASAIRRELAAIEGTAPSEGEDYAVVSLLRRLKDEPVLLALRLRLSRSLGAVFLPLSLAGASVSAGLPLSTAVLILAAGWLVLAGLETGGGGILLRKWGRWRGGASYVLWARVSQPLARLVHPLVDRDGGDSDPDHDHALILAEARAAALSGGGRLGLEERRFLRRLLASTSLLVVDIVTRWELVDRLDEHTLIREALGTVHASGHSRLPALKGDRVVGLITAKDLLVGLHRSGPELPIRSILRPVYFVRQELTVEALLEELQTARTHLAVVVDRLGRPVGIVTMEDILEEIVGELYDERERDGEGGGLR